jgi:hypothetical protein
VTRQVLAQHTHAVVQEGEAVQLRSPFLSGVKRLPVSFVPRTCMMLAAVSAFIPATLLLAMVPGPTTAPVLRQAVRDGRGAALVVIAANELGILIWALAATFGLSAVMRTSGIAYEALRAAGAAVLVLLGIRSLLSAGDALNDEAPKPRRTLGSWSASAPSWPIPRPRSSPPRFCRSSSRVGRPRLPGW